MRKIVISIVLLLCLVSLNSQTYQTSSYRVQSEEEWSVWMPVAASISLDFPAKMILIKLDNNQTFVFKIIEIGETLRYSTYQYIHMIAADSTHREHLFTIFKNTVGGQILIQIDDYTQHKIQYKLK